jgi:signal transduction histidine kinase
MRSATDSEKPRAARKSLARRVVLSTMAAGALGGALAALTAVLAVDQLIARNARQRLMGATDMLAGELDEGFEEGEWEPLGEIVADENGELVTSGIRLAVFSSGHRIAGDAWVPSIAAGGCETHGPLGARVLGCGRTYRERGWVLIAAARSDQHGLRVIYALAGLGSLLAGALVAALAGRRLSRWALTPLHELNTAIRGLAPGEREPSALLAASSCDEIEQIREALLDLNARVRALLDQARRFSADAAHELRTPLATIRAELDLLSEDARAEDDRAALGRLGARVQALGELVERLLALSSALSPSETRGETLSLSELAADAVRALPPLARARVELVAPHEALVRGDAQLLSALIGNALDNALKFSGDAPVRMLIELQDTWVRLEVHDRGPGVPSALRARVFEPFFRAEPSAAPGHGLGLALIGHIAQAHGGSAELLDAHDAPSGARLRVLLPAWTASKVARP